MKKSTFESKLCILYVVLMFFIYPVFTRGNYFNITEVKWTFFSVITGLFIVLWCCSRITDGKWFVRDGYQKILEGLLAVIVFSSAISPYGLLAWTGLSARYTGAIFMILLIVACMCIANSDFVKEVENAFCVMAIGAVLIALWSVLNFVGIDIFGMHQEMDKMQVRKFMAGIGNIVFLGSFYAMMVPMVFVLYIKSSLKKWKIFYACVLMITALGAYVCGTDGGIVAIFALQFLVLPLFVRDIKEIKWYVSGMGIMMISGIIVEALKVVCVYETGAFDQIMTIVLSFHGFWIGLIVCACIEVFLYFYGGKISVLKFKIFYYAMIAIGFVGMVALMENVRTLLSFGDNWGTDRGFMWIKACEIFKKEPVLRKLFGNGGDTFGQLLLHYIGSNVGINGQTFDNVHCEYLQWLLSYGLVGFAVIFWMFWNLIKRLLRNASDNNAGVLLAGILGYMIQAVTGLNQVFTTPLFWILCGIGMMCTRKLD